MYDSGLKDAKIENYYLFPEFPSIFLQQREAS
jgi:hypothetical protein